MASAWKPIANLTLGSTAASVTFSSITGIYKDLVLVVTGGSSGYGGFSCTFNGSGSSYTWVGMETNGSSAYAVSNAGGSLAGNYNIWVENIGSDNNIYELQLLDYSATNKHKTALYKISAGQTGVANYAGRWANTSAVTSLTVTSASSTWRTGSTFALYGVSS